MQHTNRWKALLCGALCALLAAGCGAPNASTPAAAPGPLREALTNEDEIIAAIRAGLRDYAGSITIRFTYGADILDELPALTDEWVEAALDETDDPREGDYIRYQYGGYEGACRYEATDGRYAYTVELFPEHYIYYDQEREAELALAEAYADLALDGDASDYEKIRAIYDYVCAHVKYDEIHRKNPYYHIKSTAYAALVNHTATCQGYCVLLYRMLRENGVDCRVVTGHGVDETGDQLHAWNIVALDGRYYNLDATWDAGAEEYQWFLRGSEGFANHTAGDAFSSAAFTQRYPMAAADYAAVG